MANSQLPEDKGGTIFKSLKLEHKLPTKIKYFFLQVTSNLTHSTETHNHTHYNSPYL